MQRATKMMKDFLSPVQLHKTIRQLSGSESITVTVQGECMEPLLYNNARVQVIPARWYWPGDIVVALSPGSQYQVHRVIGAYWRLGICKILTQADNAAWPDNAVLPDALLGKVSGGSCHAHAVNVPISHRLRALKCFLRFVVVRLKRVIPCRNDGSAGHDVTR